MKAPRISIRQAVAFEIFRLFRKSQTELHDLNYLFWECTLRCNLSCRHCGSDCRVDADAPDMRADDFLKVLDDVAQHHAPSSITVAITGGEPLMRPDLAAVGKEITKRGFPWGMVTNGELLTDAKLAELLDAGLRSATVSIDGLEEAHEWLRQRPGGFARASSAARRLAANLGPLFDVVTCVTPRVIPELPALAEHLTSLGVKRWRLFSIFPRGRAAVDETLHLSSADAQALMAFIDRTNAGKTIAASYSCDGFLGGYEGRARKEFFFCRAGISIGSVLADGSISACPSCRGDFVQGSIYKDSFMDVWQNRFQSMRNRRWMKRGACKDCKVHRWCNGNGMHLRTGTDSDVMTCQYRQLHD